MNSEINNQKEDPYTWMGICLVFIQLAESFLSDALQLAFHPSEVITTKSLAFAEKETRRKTLGQLLIKLRKRTQIEPDFDERLNSFLERRNIFVHNFVVREEFNMFTEKGKSRSVEFTKKLVNDTYFIISVLSGALFSFFDRLTEPTGGNVRIRWEDMPKDVMLQTIEMIRMSHDKISRLLDSE